MKNHYFITIDNTNPATLLFSNEGANSFYDDAFSKTTSSVMLFNNGGLLPVDNDSPLLFAQQWNIFRCAVAVACGVFVVRPGSGFDNL